MSVGQFEFGKIGASYFAPPCSQNWDRREEGGGDKLQAVISSEENWNQDQTEADNSLNIYTLQSRMDFNQSFDSFLLMILTSSKMIWESNLLEFELKPEYLESVLWYEDIIVLGLQLEQGTYDYYCSCHTTL